MQNKEFLLGEGDQWYNRNKSNIENKVSETDAVYLKISELFPIGTNRTVLEIGCSNGYRLGWLKNLGFDVVGIEPSQEACNSAIRKGLDVRNGTADNLNIATSSCDIVVFGFCLYLVDPDDYFKVLSEADRVLKDKGVIIIQDFAPKQAYKNKYKHKLGITSYKFDFSLLLSAHPRYVLISKEITTHSGSLVDKFNQDEWIQTSVIRKQRDLF